MRVLTGHSGMISEALLEAIVEIEKETGIDLLFDHVDFDMPCPQQPQLESSTGKKVAQWKTERNFRKK